MSELYFDERVIAAAGEDVASSSFIQEGDGVDVVAVCCCFEYVPFALDVVQYHHPSVEPGQHFEVGGGEADAESAALKAGVQIQRLVQFVVRGGGGGEGK